MAALTIAALYGSACDESSEKDACELGSVRACTGEAGCQGERACAGAPAAWGQCLCPAVDPERDAGMTGDDKPRLGSRCDEDADCPSRAFCLNAGSVDLFGGAPPIGVCVADCSDAEDACDAFTGAVCVPVAIGSPSLDEDAGVDDSDGGVEAIDPGARDHGALCFARCELGEGDAYKCGDDQLVACDALAEDTGDAGFCRPLCTTNADCAEGQCEPRHSVCVDSEVQVEPIGAACEPGAAARSCSGQCVSLEDGPGFCSQQCVFGSSKECLSAETGQQGACVFPGDRGGLGDVGYCGVLCDCSDECPGSALVCDPFADDVLERAFGHAGVCTPKESAINEPLAECAL